MDTGQYIATLSGIILLIIIFYIIYSISSITNSEKFTNMLNDIYNDEYTEQNPSLQQEKTTGKPQEPHTSDWSTKKLQQFRVYIYIIYSKLMKYNMKQLLLSVIILQFAMFILFGFGYYTIKSEINSVSYQTYNIASLKYNIDDLEKIIYKLNKKVDDLEHSVELYCRKTTSQYNY